MLREYQICMERMNGIQSRELCQYSFEFLSERFLSVLDFSGIKGTNPRYFETRPNNCRQSALRPTKHNVEEVCAIWDGINVLERRRRLAHDELFPEPLGDKPQEKNFCTTSCTIFPRAKFQL
jgi:hypothetical protein